MFWSSCSSNNALHNEIEIALGDILNNKEPECSDCLEPVKFTYVWFSFGMEGMDGIEVMV